MSKSSARDDKIAQQQNISFWGETLEEITLEEIKREKDERKRQDCDKREDNTGIPWRCYGFHSRPLHLSKYRNKTSHMNVMVSQ